MFREIRFISWSHVPGIKSYAAIIKEIYVFGKQRIDYPETFMQFPAIRMLHIHIRNNDIEIEFPFSIQLKEQDMRLKLRNYAVTISLTFGSFDLYGSPLTTATSLFSTFASDVPLFYQI